MRRGFVMSSEKSNGFVFIDKNTLLYVCLVAAGSWSNRKKIIYVEDICQAEIFYQSMHNIDREIRKELEHQRFEKLHVTITRTVEIDE
jgi:hypothetical protein